MLGKSRTGRDRCASTEAAVWERRHVYIPARAFLRAEGTPTPEGGGGGQPSSWLGPNRQIFAPSPGALPRQSPFGYGWFIVAPK